ncbi:serine/threonine-protein kinase [Pseudofrankia inefficax]|uniref:non-specific serine/threonine protein kinase n=1 Tax=Pseudofrankia inefficax (strain DSM 45817 / CECT 9037 / DDB 130130 / EuI1c) TaxID=298654 RepID=E3IVN4_PSEI1|nr:serine/threonine-protein kinase [Pseudofrankia inefficax]ADP82540.1 serine/threonine protein kinase [Pseudofrankia inefficax]
MPAIDRARVAAALPRYALGEQLGSGSFGLVLAGRHLDLDRAVAVKVLPIDDPANGPALDAAFRAEARLLSRLDHPHIVRIYEYIGQDEFCLLIMELLGGGTLAQHRLPAASACAVGLALADALGHAHAHGVLHRDIKPDNILFSVAGQPKLTDFGIGRVFVDTSASTSHLAGTPRYMAPEQITGKHLGPAVDQYALGVVLYELLAGRPPFHSGLPVPELLRHHLEEAPPALLGVPTPVADAVMRALAKAPADRHPDVGAFGAALADAAAVAYGPDWLSLTGLIVRLQGAKDGQQPRQQPDSEGHVFRPATAQLDTPPTYLTVPPPSEPAVAWAASTDQRTRPQEATDVSAGFTTAAGTGAAGTGLGEPSGPTGLEASRAEDSHPFAGTPFADRRFGLARLRRRPALLALAASLVVVAVAVTGVVLATAEGKPTAGAAVVVTSPTASQVTGGGVSGPIAIPTQFSGWAAGAGGVLYFSDKASSRIFRRGPDGKVSVLAGTGIRGSSGDGGPATAAMLNGPTGLALGPKGDLYVLDGDRVRRIATSGKITTVAGGGSDSGPSPTGPVPATSASLGFLFEDIAVDTNGDVYFADTSVLYKVDAAGTLTHVARVGGTDSVVTPLPGETDPDAGLTMLTNGYLGGLAVHDGRVYAADYPNNMIFVLNTDGSKSPVAGTGQKGYSGDGGLGTKASLNLSSLAPYKTSTLAFDSAGDLYITDAGNYRVRRVDIHGIITTVAGNGFGSYTDGQKAVTQPLYGPDRIALADDGSLLIENGTEIARVDASGNIATVQKL